MQFRVIVKDVKEKVLPDVTDEWANDVSEFDTVDELRADLADRITRVRKIQAQMALRDKAATALVELVDDEAPEALVDAEMQQRLQDLGMRLHGAGHRPSSSTSRPPVRRSRTLVDELRELAVQAVKADLALRAVADAEDIECDRRRPRRGDSRGVAERVEQKPAKVRKELERADQMPAVRSDIRKRKALDWLVEHVELVDETGNRSIAMRSAR